MGDVASGQPAGTVTLVFTDIEGSTRLLHELGQEAYREALAEHRRIVREAFAPRNGYEVDYEGDSFFYAFASAAEAVSAVSEAEAGLAGGLIRIRVGVHTGEPVLDPPKYVGMDVHRAARIMSAGHGGQVLLSKATRDLVEVETTDLSEHRLKDIEGPVWLYQLGRGEFPPLKSLNNTNLPTPASSFLGREAELAEAEQLLSSTRLLAVTGPGGTGKTRFAIEFASRQLARFPNGVFWVPLAALRDAPLVLETAAQTLGAKDGLAEHIADKRMLLLFDNFEQVVDAALELSDLLPACPNLSVIVTSRELLRIQGETEYALPPLEAEEGVALFCERTHVQPTSTVHELCARLDSLPLAIELAAGRAGLLTPEQLLERLSRRLDLLKGGRDADPRQQTLRTTIEWSHELLTREEQELFARLSVFTGGCTLQAAEDVCDADLDTLQSLLDKNLVRRSGNRYWMLETIREYAAERLDEAREVEELRARHLEWFLVFAEQAEMETRSRDRETWFARLEADHDNLRAALASARQVGEAELELRLATGLWRFWAGRGYVSEGQRRLEEALEQSPSKPLPARLGRCYLHQMTGSSLNSELLAEVEAVAAACQGEDDRFAHVQALTQIGLLKCALGTASAADEAFEKALALAGGEYPAEEAEATGWLLIDALYGPLPADEGIARCQEACERASGNRTVQAFALVERAALEAMRGEFDTARRLLSDGREVFRELDLNVFGANTAQEAYFVEMLAGDPTAAAVDLRSAYDLLEEMGERGFLSTIAGYLAQACYAQGDLGGAERYSGLSAKAAAEDDFQSQALWRAVHAKLLAHERDFDRARHYAREAVRLTQPTEWINAQADRFTDLAQVLLLAGQPDEAAGALGEALRRYEQKGNLVSAGRTRAALATLPAPRVEPA
jgi:predicted ATPase/class 3 adenylate cyclase